jgi:hypothetical protein
LIVAALLAIAAARPALSFGVGQLGAHFGQLGSEGGSVPPVAPTGFLLINTGSVMLISAVPSKFKIQ